jgi:prefoldin subunit 5
MTEKVEAKENISEALSKINTEIERLDKIITTLSGHLDEQIHSLNNLTGELLNAGVIRRKEVQ